MARIQTNKHNLFITQVIIVLFVTFCVWIWSLLKAIEINFVYRILYEVCFDVGGDKNFDFKRFASKFNLLYY